VVPEQIWKKWSRQTATTQPPAACVACREAGVRARRRSCRLLEKRNGKKLLQGWMKRGHSLPAEVGIGAKAQMWASWGSEGRSFQSWDTFGAGAAAETTRRVRSVTHSMPYQWDVEARTAPPPLHEIFEGQ